MSDPEIRIRFRVGAAFGAFGEPGEEAGTRCLWCGKKLRQVRFPQFIRDHGGAVPKGGYGDNAFCGLRCGYSFGVAVASTGTRIERDND